MKLGSVSPFRKGALDIILHNLYERLLEEQKIKKAFLITEETYFLKDVVLGKDILQIIDKVLGDNND